MQTAHLGNLKKRGLCLYGPETRRYSLMVKLQTSNLATRVRFPLAAPPAEAGFHSFLSYNDGPERREVLCGGCIPHSAPLRSCSSVGRATDF